MADFHYLPLEPQRQSFRLLKLLKGNSVDIRCELHHDYISGDSIASYEALSYTWGSTELVERIQVNGKVLWITDNLYAVLQSLRSYDSDRVLWIDGICINQLDIQERSQQVQRMRLIYNSAQNVIIWLGKATPEVQLLVQSLVEQSSKIAVSTDQETTDTGPVSSQIWTGLQKFFSSSSHTEIERQRKGLQLLLKRPWFRRVWILQEVANAKAAVVYAGSSLLPAYLLAMAPSLLSVDPEMHVHAVLKLMPTFDQSKETEKRRNLLHLLKSFQTSEATDERDIFYALLGMSSDPQDHALLRADYTKTTTDVAHDVIRYWFQQSSATVSETLDFLAEFDLVCTTIVVQLKGNENIEKALEPWWESISRASGEKDSGHELDTAALRAICARSYVQLEQCRSEFPKDAYCTDIDQLRQELALSRRQLSKRDFFYTRERNLAVESLKPAVKVMNWKYRTSHVRFLVVKSPQDALMLCGILGCDKVFALIVQSTTVEKQGLLNSTLSIAIDRGPEYERVVRLALGMGADANTENSVVMTDLNEYGRVLTRAARLGNKTIVRMLLDAGADVNHEDAQSGTALRVAALRGNTHIVHLLLDAGADVDRDNARRGTALRVAAVNGHTHVVRLLLDAGADVNSRGHLSRSALDQVALSGDLDMIKVLLERGAAINSQGRDGQTPLMMAILGSNKAASRHLIKAGADLSLTDHSGRTAVDLLKISDLDEELLRIISEDTNVSLE